MKQRDLQSECEYAPRDTITDEDNSHARNLQSKADKRQRVALFLLSACALGISFGLAHTHTQGPPCLFRAALHVPCPGCGLTRSFNALWHGDLITSFRYHPLGLPLFLLFTVYVASAALQGKVPIARKLSDRLNKSFYEAWVWQIATGLLVGFWIVRLGLMVAGSRYFLW